MPRGGEAGHVGADLGDDRLRGGPANATDLIQPLDRRPERGDLGLDLAVQFGDVDAGLVDAAQHRGQQEGVVVGELAGQRLTQRRELDPHPAVGQVGEDPGITLTGDHRIEHLAAGHAVQIADDRVEFDLRVFEDLLQP